MKRFYCLVLGVLALPGMGRADDQKLVLAHYMTDMVPRTRQKLIRWIDPELAEPGGSTAALGGLHQTVPMASLHLQDADLEKAVDFEIRAARQLGIDGFQFYYPLVDHTPVLARNYNAIIAQFIRLSDSRYKGFRISLCLAHPATGKPTSEKEKISLWSPPIRELLNSTGKSPAWLRAGSGSLLFYLWVGDALADGIDGLAHKPAEIKKVAEAYQRFSKAIGTPIEFVYQVRRPEIDAPYIDSIVKTFPAVWGWTASDENLEFWDYLARRCRQEGCLYTQSVYPDYYTSKVYARGKNNHAILPTGVALKAGLDGIERHYRVTNLAQTQLLLLERAIRHDVKLINYVTWNDFPEGHHLAPEASHNFGPSLLLRHFKRRWKSGKEDILQDEAIVFFKKYRHDAKPKYPVELKVKSRNRNLAGEDRIELVTLLRKPARCTLNGKSLGMVGQGLRVHSIPSEPGPVRVLVVREGKQVIRFKTPLAISNSPLRTDRLTYSYSSSFEDEYRKLFD